MPNATPWRLGSTLLATTALVIGWAIPFAAPPATRNVTSPHHDVANSAVPAMQAIANALEIRVAQRPPSRSVRFPPGIDAIAEEAVKIAAAIPTRGVPKSRSPRIAMARVPVRNSGRTVNAAYIVAPAMARTSELRICVERLKKTISVARGRRSCGRARVERGRCSLFY